jgi:gamma-glutamylputrescine oxidase
LLAGTACFYHYAVRRWGRGVAAMLYAETLAGIEAIARETPEAVWRTGSVRVAMDEDERRDVEAHADALRADAFGVEPWSGTFGTGGGIRIPEDGVFHPVDRLQTLADRCWEEGAWMFGDSPVVSIEPGRVVLAAGEVVCGAVLVCVDGGLERVLPALSGRVEQRRLQMLSTSPVGTPLGTGAYYARYGLDYWQQTPDGRVVLGGCRDLDEQEGRSAEIVPTSTVQAGLDRLLERVIGQPCTVEHRWAGGVGYTPSGLPILEQVEDGVFAAGGYCGTGNVIGKLAGEALAEVACGASWPTWAEAVRRASRPLA